MYGILGTVKVSCVSIHAARVGVMWTFGCLELAKICMWSEYWGGEEFKTNG